MLSVCIIAKNEENNISRCLASIEDIGDEIIVVDTGSTDYTVPIAESYGAKIIRHDFDHDFSQARNISIENATKKWILYIDCDEQLDPEDAPRLRKMLKTKVYEGFCLSLINVIDGKKQLTLPSLRVFRNRKEYRFQGKIHEQINPSIERRVGKGKIHVSDIKLYHYGYDENYADRTIKIKRNIELFESYTEEEKNGFYYYNLANEYLRLDDLEKALSYYYKAEEGEDENGYKIYLIIYIMKTLHGLNRFEEAVAYGKKALETYPNYKDLHFLMTACYYELEQYAQSKEHLLLYMQYAQQQFGYPEFNFTSSNDIDRLLVDLTNLAP